MLFVLAVPFPALYLLAILNFTQAKRDGKFLNPRIPKEAATPRRRLRWSASLSQRSSSQPVGHMDFPEPNVPAGVSEFHAIILAGYGNA